MLLIPTLELSGHQVVFSSRDGKGVLQKVPCEKTLEQCLRELTQAGADRLHIVDLDGAKHGKPINGKLVREIVSIVESINDFTEIELGGGIRTLDQVDQVLAMGVQYVVLGTGALKQPGFLHDACSNFGGNIVLSMDVLEGKVWVEARQTPSKTDAFAFAHKVEDLALDAILVTDLSRAGTLSGMNEAFFRAMTEVTRTPILAAGGLTSLEDVKRLSALESDGLLGVVMGRALQETPTLLEQACAWVDEQPNVV